jgi:hypothetical protein
MSPGGSQRPHGIELVVFIVVAVLVAVMVVVCVLAAVPGT